MFFAKAKWDGKPLDEMKPCPFCGAPAGLTHKGNDRVKKRFVTIKCIEPGCCQGITVGALRYDMAWCEEKALERWNQRA